MPILHLGGGYYLKGAGSHTCPAISSRRKGKEYYCRGIVTVDVLVKGLSRGAIATRKLEGVNRDKGHEIYTGSAPYSEGKSL